jgi:hypothetical protein
MMTAGNEMNDTRCGASIELYYLNAAKQQQQQL